MNAAIKSLRSGKYCRDLFWLPPQTCAEIQRGQDRIGDTFATSVFCHTAYRQWGAQIRVQKEVSDDMLQTDLGNTTMDEIPWPAKAVEMFFEDPALPTLALAKLTVPEIEKMIPGLTIAPHATNPSHWIYEPRVILCINLVESIWDQVLFKDERFHMEKATPLDNEEDQVLKEALRLAIKVFAYASLPRYKPVPVTEITKKMGGKPGFRDRPKRPALRVVYLPSVHTVLPETNHEPTGQGKTHAFKGRRGFFRTFRHERYTVMRGKRIFVAPIVVDKGIHEKQTIYVRQPV
jgi:hypothetical protein